MVACLLSVLLAGVAATSFYGELRERSWRFAAHGALLVVLAVALWTYWPKNHEAQLHEYDSSLRSALGSGAARRFRHDRGSAAPQVESDRGSLYRAHIARLASDEFGGRKPGTEAEKRTLDYLEPNFASWV